MIHRREMLLPQCVEHLQHHLLFHLAHVRPDFIALPPVSALRRLDNAGAHALLMQGVVRIQPLPHRALHREFGAQLPLQAVNVPLLFQTHRRHEAANQAVHHIVADGVNHLGDVVRFQQFIALLVDDPALVVGDIVVFQQLLAHVEVAVLHLALRLLDGVGDHAVLDGLAFLHAQRLHETLHPFRCEDAHEVVFQGEVEAGDAGVALPAGAAAQLVVDAPGFVAFGAEDVQPAGRHHRAVALPPIRFDLFDFFRSRRFQGADFRLPVAAQHNVGAAPGHVGGDGHGAAGPGLRDNLRLLLMVFGVQHLVADLRRLEAARDCLGGFHGGGAHQHRRAAADGFFYILDDGIVFLLAGEVHQIVQVAADLRHIGGNHHHLQAVNLAELEGFGVGGAGHAGQFAVKPEIVLESGGGEGLRLALNRHAFFGFDGLMQPLGEAAARHGAAGVLVDEHHLPLLHDVFHIPVEQHMRPQGAVHMVQQPQVGGGVEAVALFQQLFPRHQFFHELVAGFGQFDLAQLFIHRVVAVGSGGLFRRGRCGRRLLIQRPFNLRLLLLHRRRRRRAQPRNKAVDAPVQFRAALRRAGDDQRRARLVDQDGIHFVDDGEGQLPLHLLGLGESHVVPQIIEAELVVGAVDDVRLVGGALLHRPLPGLNHAHLEAEEFVQGAHPRRIPPGEVVIHRHQMHGLAADGIQVGRQSGDEGLAFAGAHLGDFAFVQGDAADELHIEVAHAQSPLAGFAGDGEGFRQQLVQAFPAREPLPELGGLGAQLAVVQRAAGLSEGVDAGHDGAHALEIALIGAAEDPFQQC